MFCRSSDSSAAEWWPGGIHSPQVYYHLRARQLRYAQKFPKQAGISFRGPREVHTHQSMLLKRRRQGPLAVLVPTVYTNVNQNDSSVHYLGDKVLQLTSRPATVVTPSPGPSVAIASAAAAAMKRGIETPVRPPHLTWSHHDDSTENMLVSRRSSGSSITTCGMALDPKRRCTIQGGSNNKNATTSFLPAGHFIARTSPSSTASPPRVYPGVVLLHNNNKNGNCQQFQHQQQQQLLHNGTSASSGLTPATLLGVVTPPLASIDPLSADSSSSITSVGPLSTRGSADVAVATTAPWSSAPMPTHSVPVWELTSASAQRAMVDQSTTVPVISKVHDTNTHYSTRQYNHQNHQDQDPTMQQYYARQYNIKQEQAFPCHQVVEIGPNAISAVGKYSSDYGNNNVAQIEGGPEEDAAAGSDVGGWAVELLRSLAGSIKRSVSP